MKYSANKTFFNTWKIVRIRQKIVRLSIFSDNPPPRQAGSLQVSQRVTPSRLTNIFCIFDLFGNCGLFHAKISIFSVKNILFAYESCFILNLLVNIIEIRFSNISWFFENLKIWHTLMVWGDPISIIAYNDWPQDFFSVFGDIGAPIFSQAAEWGQVKVFYLF